MAITEINSDDISSVSGAGTQQGAAMTLVAAGLGTVGGILAFTPFAAIGGVLMIGGAGIGALAYAYDHYSDAQARSGGGSGGNGGGAGGFGGGGISGIATKIVVKKSK